MTDAELPPEFKDLMDVFGGEPEELHPDLVPYVTEGSLGTMLHHPLVIQMFFHDRLHKLANLQYRQKSEALERAQEQEAWSSYIFLHERPYRLGAFIDIEPNLSDEDYWSMLSGLWIDSENISQDQDTWWALLTAQNLPERRSVDGRKKFFMDDADRLAYENLPMSFDIYRGVDRGGNERGLSWTLDKERAEWFARRFHGHGTLLTTRIVKGQALALLTGRNESEIICKPGGFKRSKVLPK